MVRIRERGREYEVCVDMNCRDWKKDGNGKKGRKGMG